MLSALQDLFEGLTRAFHHLYTVSPNDSKFQYGLTRSVRLLSLDSLQLLRGLGLPEVPLYTQPQPTQGVQTRIPALDGLLSSLVKAAEQLELPDAQARSGPQQQHQQHQQPQLKVEAFALFCVLGPHAQEEPKEAAEFDEQEQETRERCEMALEAFVSQFLNPPLNTIQALITIDNLKTLQVHLFGPRPSAWRFRDSAVVGSSHQKTRYTVFLPAEEVGMAMEGLCRWFGRMSLQPCTR